MGDGVGIGMAWHLQRPLELSVGDFAVGQPEALGLASLTGQLPHHLHRCGVHHLGEEGWWSGHCELERGRK